MPRTSTGSAPAARSSARGLLGGAVVAQVADRDPLRAVAREAEGDRAADPARPAGDEDVQLDGSGPRGSGWSAGAALGMLLPAGPRLRPRAGPPRPSTRRGRAGRAARSSVSAYRRTSWSSGRPATSSLDPRAQLVGEVRRRRADEGVDVGAGGLGASSRPSLTALGSVGWVRRVSAVDVMLLATVLLWALNIDRVAVRRHARLPSARLRGDPVLRGDPALRGRSRGGGSAASGSPAATCRSSLLAGAIIFLNQLAFVYGVKLTSASTIGLMLGTVPIWAAIIATLVGLERPTPDVLGRRARLVRAASALIAAGASGGLTGDLLGNLLALSRGGHVGRLLRRRSRR